MTVTARATHLRFAVQTKPPNNWNELALRAQTESLQLYHTTPWADRLRGLLGDTPVFLTVADGENVVLMAIVFIEAKRPAAGSGLRRLKSVVRNRLAAGRRIRWYGQPLVIGDAEPDVLRSFAAGLFAWARANGLRLAGGEWPVSAEPILPTQWTARRWATLRVALDADVETLRRRLKPAARKAIRKAETAGVVVQRVATDSELAEYVRHAVVWAERYGRTDITLDDFRSLWTHFRQPGFFFETFAARHDGELVAGLSIWGTMESVGEIGSFQSQRCFEEKLSAPDLIKWSVIEWAREVGVPIFDLAGINPSPTTPKEENIRRFKEKWGGVLHEYLILSE